MSALDKVSNSDASKFNDLSHVYAEIATGMKTSGLVVLAGDAASQESAKKHLPKCTLGDLTGTVPRDCQWQPKPAQPIDIPKHKEPNKFGPSNPRFD